MAVPRLRTRACFIALDVPPEQAGRAATIAGATELGAPIHPRELPPIDLVVCGVVAVDVAGARVGKGGGYADLELAIGQAFGAIGPDTAIVATCHDLQLRDGALPQDPHDLGLDAIFTPTRTLRCPRRVRPAGVLWDALDADKRAAIPILDELKGA